MQPKVKIADYRDAIGFTKEATDELKDSPRDTKKSTEAAKKVVRWLAILNQHCPKGIKAIEAKACNEVIHKAELELNRRFDQESLTKLQATCIIP